MPQTTATPADLAWLLDDLVDRTRDARHGIILSDDGLLMACSRELGQGDAEHLSAVAAGLQSLAKGVGQRFGGGSVRQTIIEMRQAYLLVTVAGQGTCLAVLCGRDADVGVVAYEMAMLVTRVGQYLISPARNPEARSDAPR